MKGPSILATLALALAACGGGSSTTDAPKPADAFMSSVKTVTCPATPDTDVSVNAGGTAYVITNATIPVNGVAHLHFNSFHDAQSGAPGAPNGNFKVGFGGDACLQFTAAGTFAFFCEAHLFTGALTVQ